MTAEDTKGRSTQDLAWDQLKTCFDPEIPVNIVDLGLVYKVEAQPLDGGGERVHVEFTLTAPGCGMGDFLRQDVEQKLLAIPGVKGADVEVVLDPPWDQSMMSDVARLQLGLM
jgi:probable FeS assembly SUF system protein SufT